MQTLAMLVGLLANQTLIYAAPPDLTGFSMDSQKNENGVELVSGKKDDIRVYYAKVSRSYAADLITVEPLITNFEEKCNNQHKMRRRYLSKEYNCPYLNKNLVESSIVKALKIPPPAEVDEAWVVRRHIFNRGTFGHNDLLSIKRTPPKTIVVEHSMLSEQEAAKYIDSPIAHQEPFDSLMGTYTAEYVSPQETKVTYEYLAKTDHFVLNKEISVTAIFSSIAEGTILALQSIEDGLALKKGIKVGQNQ